MAAPSSSARFPGIPLPRIGSKWEGSARSTHLVCVKRASRSVEPCGVRPTGNVPDGQPGWSAREWPLV